MKKRNIPLLLTMAVLSAAYIQGCGQSGNADNSATTAKTESEGNFIEVSERTENWFADAAEEYVKETFGETDFKLYSRLYDVRQGVSEKNVLLYVSADMYLYFDAEDVQTQDTADFSDTFARKFASDGAAGDIKFSVYTIPENIYDQIEEDNHTQIEEKAKETEGYSKFGFNYSGIGDAVYTQGGSETNTEAEKKE